MNGFHTHETDAKIILREQRNPLWDITESVICEWDGGKLAAIRVNYLWHLFQDLKTARTGDVVNLGGLRLRCVDYEIRTRTLYVMKDGWKSNLYYWLYKALIPLTITYHRLIITAMVWRLADDIEETAIPSWRDLKIAKRFLNKEQ